MTSLIKNELIKIFHKKGLYFLSLLVILFAVLSTVITRYEDRIEEKINNMMDNALCTDEVDLNSPDIDLISNIELKVNCDIAEKKVKYDYNSEEYYYLTHDLTDLLNEAYSSKYIEHDDEAYNTLMTQYNQSIENLDKKDWFAMIKDKKTQKEQELELLKKDSSSNSNDIKQLKDEIYVLNYRLDHRIAYTNNNESKLLDDFIDAANIYYSYDLDESSIKEYSQLANKRDAERGYYTVKYRIDNELHGIYERSIANDVFFTFSSINFMILFAILIIIGGIVAEEFNKGTIKQLLVKPFSRYKILLSKMLAGLIAVAAFYVFYVIVNILQGIASYGNIKTLFDPILMYNFNSGKVMELNLLQGLGLNIILQLPRFLIMYIFIFMIGVITTNTAATIVFGFGFYVVWDLAIELLSIPAKVASWIFYYCWDFKQYITGELPMYGSFELMKNSSLLKSSIVCLITFVILTIVAFVVFKKKDIKNQ